MSWKGLLLRAGIESDGTNVKIPLGTITARNFASAVGNVWYVDSTVTTSGTGKSWSKAFKTITEAAAAVSARDTICVVGSFTEAVTLSTAKVSIIGMGTGPDMTTWTAATDAVCLTISAADCYVENIRLRPPARTSGSPAAIQLSSAGYTTIRKCRFQGKSTSYYAIYSPVCNSDNVVVEDCEFIYMNTATYGAAILGVEAGGLSYSGWQIRNCIFNSCVTAIDINGRVCNITGCTIYEYGINSSGAVAAVLAKGIDLSGTSSGGNSVWGNQLGGAYNATLYVVGTSGDQWGGNFNVLSGGVTAANPS